MEQVNDHTSRWSQRIKEWEKASKRMDVRIAEGMTQRRWPDEFKTVRYAKRTEQICYGTEPCDVQPHQGVQLQAVPG